MTIVLIALALVYVFMTIAIFIGGILSYWFVRDSDQEAARANARFAMVAPLWPITFAKLIGQALKEARKDRK